MTQAPAYKSTVRNYQQFPQINSGFNDKVNENGVRISLPCYIDLTTAQRKQLLNGVRDACAAVQTTTQSKTASGLTVETPTSAVNDVESYLGLSLDMLRNALFSRGGLTVDLALKLQSVTGIELVSVKDIKAALTAKGKFIENWLKEYSYGVQTTETSS